MNAFLYTALDGQGRKTTGSLQAPSRPAALEQLARQGLTPVRISEQAHQARPAAPRRAGVGRVSGASVEAFIRELANLLSAGVPLARAMSIIAREASQASARAQWTAIHDDVVGGANLADAMGKWPRSFGAVQVAMIRAGEVGGFLETVLAQIADFRFRERDLKSKVKGAMIYPAVLAVLAVGVLTFLLVFFIPRFSSVFEEFGATLPALTRGVMAVSRAASRYGLLVLLGAGFAVILVRRVLSSHSGRRLLERALLRMPAIGTLAARLALVRFCRMLGTLLAAGVPLVASLKVARESLGNQILADAVSSAIEEVQQGAPLAGSLAACHRLFPASAVEMIAVAEESSRLDKELVRMALAYEADLDRQLRMLISLAEPAMLFIMAAIVGTIVVGMLLPVFTLQDYIH
jgi:type II secretory pathway component PulF